MGETSAAGAGDPNRKAMSHTAKSHQQRSASARWRTHYERDVFFAGVTEIRETIVVWPSSHLTSIESPCTEAIVPTGAAWPTFFVIFCTLIPVRSMVTSFEQ